MTAPLDLARRRRCAWLRVLDAVAEMREALEHRIWRADPDDTHLKPIAKAWAELALRSLTSSSRGGRHDEEADARLQHGQINSLQP